MTHHTYAIHGENPLRYPGWEIRTEELGHDPTHDGGTDYRNSPHTVIARLNNGYFDRGTLPEPEHYEAFAARCARFVANSRGCERWIIGNEPNLEVERPHGQPITPADYARCYALCRDAIKNVQPDAQVIVAAVGPWNIQTAYEGNERGDWVQYFRDIQNEIRGKVYGFAIHAYAHDEQTPEAVTSEAMMSAPFSTHHWHFRVYRDWMNNILPSLRGLPVYLTEVNANREWRNERTGFVQAVYREIDDWNHAYPGRPILCAALFRWGVDKYRIDDKSEVLAEFWQAVHESYTVPVVPGPGVEPQPQPEPPQPEPPTPQPAPDYAEALTRIEAMLIEQGAQLDELMERFRVAGFALAGEQ